MTSETHSRLSISHSPIRALNPQPFLGAFHLNQAIEVTGGQRVLHVSGQTSTDPSGAPQRPGDVVAQFKLAWANLVEVLAAANMTPANIVRLNFYTTDDCAEAIVGLLVSGSFDEFLDDPAALDLGDRISARVTSR